MARFLLHTSHILSKIYNSANIPDQSKHLQTIGKKNWIKYISSFSKLYVGERRWRRTIGDVDTENLHACAILMYISIRPAWVGGHNNSVHCATWMEEVYCGTVAQMKEKNNQHSNPHGSTGCRHHFTSPFLEDKVELSNKSSLFHISAKHTLCHLEHVYWRRQNENMKRRWSSSNSLRTHWHYRL